MKRALLAIACLAGCDAELSYGRLLADASTSTCEARGPLFAVGDCTRALCSCGDFISSASTRSLGSLGVGGLFNAGNVNVTGSLTLAGDAPITGDLNVSQSLLEQGALQGEHTVIVGGDARIGGDVRLNGLQVAGALTLSPSSALEVPTPPPALRAAVNVANPCDCTPKLDIGAQIDAARASNDNTMIKLDPELGLRTFTDARTLDLPCGSYYVQQIYAASPITLNVHGRVALYVEQRIVTEAASSLTIALDSSAQLDLFIRAGVTGAGPIALRGGSARIYVGGGDTFFFAAPTQLEASLYAPNSELVSQQRFALTGSALVKRVVAEGELVLQRSCD